MAKSKQDEQSEVVEPEETTQEQSTSASAQEPEIKIEHKINHGMHVSFVSKR